MQLYIYLLSRILGAAPLHGDVLTWVHSQLQRLVEVLGVGRDGDAELHGGHNAATRDRPVTLC